MWRPVQVMLTVNFSPGWLQTPSRVFLNQPVYHILKVMLLPVVFSLLFCVLLWFIPHV